MSGVVDTTDKRVFQTREDVKHYYGAVLGNSADLKTTACCSTESLPEYLRPILSKLHPEVKDKFYGCGSPIPSELTDSTVLDLGCGTGRDVFLLSKLVGEKGRVIGVDMTEEQLNVANKYENYHATQFGYSTPNTRFLHGYIEDLSDIGVADESIDVVVSNCVINLSPDKNRVFEEIFRVLKPGGELYFSDIFADRRISPALQTDPVLLGECLGGALYFEDFRRLIQRIGCADIRIVNRSPVTVTDQDILRRLGPVQFESITVRAFKLELEDRCEDYGQIAYYLGTISELPNSFRLDDHHLFEKNRPVLVCGNTADMLQKSRLKSHFRIEGSKTVHFGLFDCSENMAPSESAARGSACC